MEHMLISAKTESLEPVAATDNKTKTRYPYGLELNLDRESLAKLDRSASDFKAGQELMVKAKAEVRMVQSVDHIDNETAQAYPTDLVEIQITHLELKPAKDDFDEAWDEIND